MKCYYFGIACIKVNLFEENIKNMCVLGDGSISYRRVSTRYLNNYFFRK
jgi:hypothetical protein